MIIAGPDDAIPFAEVRRALVIKLRHHGDVLLTSPVFSTLKHAAPHVEIDALVYADTAPMLMGHPSIAQIHTIDRNWKKQGVFKQASAEWRLLQTLRGRDYDLVIHLTEHPRGAWLARWVGARWAVAPKRAGKFWKKSFTHQYSQPGHARRHTVEKNLDALRRIGVQPEPKDKKLIMTPGTEAEARVAALLEAGRLADSFIHVHPASRWLFKCWPADRMAALIDALVADGYPVVVTGAPDEREKKMIAEIRATSSAPWLDLSGQLSLRELAALTSRAKLFVGVDSAPMHIAAAMGTPTVSLFGPSGELEWSPWGVPHQIVASEVHPCRPCGQDGCGGSKVSECLTTLPLARVMAACHSLL